MSKRICIKNITIKDSNIDKLVQIAIIKQIKSNFLLDLTLKTDLNRISGKNLLVKNKLISYIYYKIAKIVTKISNKI